MYNSHIPPPIPNSNYICYADDVTQIITNHSKSKNVMAIHTQRAIVPINRFEYQWKMQTNTTKFQIISAAKIKPTPLIINRTGYLKHFFSFRTGILNYIFKNLNLEHKS